MFISEMMRLIQMMIFMVVWHTEQNIIKKRVDVMQRIVVVVERVEFIIFGRATNN